MNQSPSENHSNQSSDISPTLPHYRILNDINKNWIYLVSLNLIASAEASLKLDYFKRVNRKPRSKIDQALQKMVVMQCG